MALAEKISRIWDEQEKTKQKFMAEVYQNMQQIDAMKTQREVENRQKLEREQLRKAQTITGTQTTLTDTGQTITTAYESGRTRMDVTEDKRTPKPVAPKTPQIKRIEVPNAVQIWKDGVMIKEFKKPEKPKGLSKEEAKRIETEESIAGWEEEITYLDNIRKQLAPDDPNRTYYEEQIEDIRRKVANAQGKLGKKKTSADVGTTGNNRLTDDERNQANNITGKLGF
jgi:hypothetical protein